MVNPFLLIIVLMFILPLGFGKIKGRASRERVLAELFVFVLNFHSFDLSVLT